MAVLEVLAGWRIMLYHAHYSQALLDTGSWQMCSMIGVDIILIQHGVLET